MRTVRNSWPIRSLSHFYTLGTGAEPRWPRSPAWHSRSLRRPSPIHGSVHHLPFLSLHAGGSSPHGLDTLWLYSRVSFICWNSRQTSRPGCVLPLLEVFSHTLLPLQHPATLTSSIVGAVIYRFVLLLAGAGSWHQIAFKDSKRVVFPCVLSASYLVDAQWVK